MVTVNAHHGAFPPLIILVMVVVVVVDGRQEVEDMMAEPRSAKRYSTVFPADKHWRTDTR